MEHTNERAPMTTAETITTVLRAAGHTGITTLLWGAPGTGKTALVNALAEANDALCETVLGVVREPTDFSGLPIPTETSFRLAPPDWAERLHEAGHGVLFLDELSTAPPAVQAAMLGVVFDHKVGDLALPSDVQVIAAANPPDQAAGGFQLSPPMANRLLHIDYSPPVLEWVGGVVTDFPIAPPRWVGVPNKTAQRVARADIAAFIRTRPELLDACPRDPAQAGLAWPSRRTWTMSADILAVLDPTDDDARLLATAGLVGEGAAAEYFAWSRTGDLPDPADVVTDPSHVAWADLEASRAFAVLAAVIAHTTAPGTIEPWRSAWKVLAIAAEAGLADVAALHAHSLIATRPGSARPPREARTFSRILTDAGLMGAN